MTRQEEQVFTKLYGEKAAIFDGLDLIKLYGFFPPLDTLAIQELLNESNNAKTDSRE